MRLPIGLVYGADDTVVLDPDRQIQASLHLVFETFAETGSASAAVKRFQREHLEFPRRLYHGPGKGKVLWGPINHSRVLQILHNPRYAGAFVYGRTRSGRTAELRPTTHKVARADWSVLIPAAHAGYIDWPTYERNQRRLRDNAHAFGAVARGSVPREGPGLLQGRILCGRCGARMRVRYQQVSGILEPYYVCTEAAVRTAARVCQSVRGRAIDEAVGAVLLERIAPTALELALAVKGEIAARVEQAQALRAAQLERARYEAELARRRYLHVDPANRLVADTLEANWNDTLRALDTLHAEHERLEKTDQQLLGDEAAAERIRALAEDFPRMWNDPHTAAQERKRMVALLIEDVTLVKANEVQVHLRFRGGRTQTLSVALPLPIARVRKTRDAVVAALDRLLDTCTDGEAAAELNALGHRNWQGQSFTAKKVALVHSTYGLKSRYERLRARGLLTGPELARRLGVSSTTIHTLGRQGLLRRQLYGRPARCLYEPLDGIIRIKGRGGRRARPATVIAAPPSAQEIV